ncbi:hypothetical protein FE810_01155 [Thalassotalea litorea]|uniref:KfrA N-terminal DNA-binding domain-containing protein n=1 Tax=Thalassotalea litorea TaxID=2020715 RepID=A0A5R9IPX2_9GAMM|nr:hypothetical protein [Thalassotalea litorea]TLU67585.1 hypothetical protein FE810_01155 [Thalassotalea litorea]
MSQQEIYRIAQQLNAQGKTPSVALIKSQLSVTLPLTTIIKGLQQWQKNPQLGETTTPSSSLAAKDSVAAEDLSLNQVQQQFIDLQQKVQALELEVSQLKQQVKALTSDS